MANNVGYSLLLVDDQADSVKPLCMYLRRSGFDVRFAEDVAQASRCFDEFIPDLILLDLTLGEVSGFDVIQQWRADTRIADIPVLLFSGHMDTERKVEGLTCGAVDYIIKGTDLREIVARINLHLRLRDHERALAQKCAELQEARGAVVRAEQMAAAGRLTAEIASDLAGPLSYMISGLKVMRDDLREMTAAMETCRPSAGPHQGAEAGELFCSEARRNTFRDMEEIARECVEGAEVIERLTTNLREFAHGGAGGVGVLDLNPLVDEAMVRAMAVQPQARIVRNYGHMAPVSGNAERIRHLVFLLASNAMRSGEVPMVLTVATHQDREVVRVEMTVQGAVREGEAGRIARADSGLDWSFAQHIAEAHGGSVTVSRNDAVTLHICALLPLPPVVPTKP